MVANLSILSAFCFVQIPCELSVSILKQAGHDVPEEKNEPLEERALFCDNNWLFDLEFLVNVNDHLKSSEYQIAEQESVVS